MSINIAVIAGTGMGQLLGNTGTRIDTFTPFGTASYFKLMVDGMEIIFVDRHHSSLGQFRLPHQLNHRAYMWALAQAGVQFVIATSAVGGINGPNNVNELTTKSIVVPEDFINLPGNTYTFAYEGGLVHETAFHRSPVGMFCPTLCDLVQYQVDYQHGILACTLKGPRYETLPEVLIHRDQHHVNFLGMTTAVPEAILAREAAMHYLLLANVTNLPLEGPPADGEDVKLVVAQKQQRLLQVIKNLIQTLDLTSPKLCCECIKKPSVFEMCDCKF